MKHILWNLLWIRRVKCDDELDGYIRLVELVGDLERRVCSQRMANDDHDSLMTTPILVDDTSGNRMPSVRAVNTGIITLPIELISEGVHPARKDVCEPTKQIGLHLR